MRLESLVSDVFPLPLPRRLDARGRGRGAKRARATRAAVIKVQLARRPLTALPILS